MHGNTYIYIYTYIRTYIHTYTHVHICSKLRHPAWNADTRLYDVCMVEIDAYMPISFNIISMHNNGLLLEQNGTCALVSTTVYLCIFGHVCACK